MPSAASVCLFACVWVCLSVCLFVNTITSERVNIGWWNLEGRCIVQKSSPSSNLGVIAPRVCTLNNVSLHYDVGKISSGCLVLITLICELDLHILKFYLFRSRLSKVRVRTGQQRCRKWWGWRGTYHPNCDWGEQFTFHPTLVGCFRALLILFPVWCWCLMRSNIVEDVWGGIMFSGHPYIHASQKFVNMIF